MNVLWFNVTEPSGYKNNNLVIGGWQSSLEEIIKQDSNIKLHVAFEAKNLNDKPKSINNVTYIPFQVQFNLIERIRKKWNFQVYAKKVLVQCIKIVESIKPDIIHVFGTEWPYGLIQKYTKIPVVIHIQGAIIPYCNALYPPQYNEISFVLKNFWNIRKWVSFFIHKSYYNSWKKTEAEIWDAVSYYMGRTCWDKSVVNVQHPGATYYHVEEALRQSFINNENTWEQPEQNKKKILLSTGCSTYWKGPDMLLKTAVLLKKIKFDFTWYVAGQMPKEIKSYVEYMEQQKFSDNNVEFLGMVNPDKLQKLLCNSNLYIHTAYIENSPNSVCEAQITGIPIISTNVGGIESLVHQDQEGILVPANDPWRMAYSIIELSSNLEKQQKFSANGINHAKNRHNPDNIHNQLIYCYQDIIKKTHSENKKL